ncbi:unnamed protein product [Prorocentrum cordatum]|uniref:Calmodulin n=1 Tax=Prorocentrum cordatum TaxID=2364126 RepID=A0ABN9UZX3_9DINO|nr:unnamed protein product [Polarella glacialis]
MDEATCQQVVSAVVIVPGSGDARERPFKDGREEPYVDLDGFMQAALGLLSVTRLAAAAREGFSCASHAELRHLFGKHGKSAGKLTPAELTLLVQESFSDAVDHEGLGPAVRQAVSQASSAETDWPGWLNFNEFVALVRRIQDIEDTDRVDRERAAIEATGFEPAQVDEFRELFIKNDVDGVGEIPERRVQRLLASIEAAASVPLERLRAAARRRADRGPSDRSRRGSCEALDFPEFLCLMKEVLGLAEAGALHAAAQDRRGALRPGDGRGPSAAFGATLRQLLG